MKQYAVREKISETADMALQSVSPLLRSLLFYRNITDEETARAFLSPDYSRDLHDPFLMLDMEKAVERIQRGIRNGEKIIIYGDYDCDGIPGSVVLHDFFAKIAYPHFSVYIPHRYNEGYGLQMLALEQFAKDGVKLMVTVDCGITDTAEVARANELGIDVIITDHHLPHIDPQRDEEKLPPAYAVINNKRRGDTYPFSMLCGAGTAFKLVQALVTRPLPEWNIHAGWEKWLLDMAGLSTIADMVPLTGENRAIAYFGLQVLRKSRRPGLRELLRVSKVPQETVTEDDIGFSIAPRINAASRIADPFDGFRVLSVRDPTEAIPLGAHLEAINRKRKGIVAAMTKDAHGRLAERGIRDVIVVGDPLWLPGLVGLTANALMETYEKPVFVWGREGSPTIKGSCRSPGVVNVVELMTHASDSFLDFGGHELSGGFSVSHERIHFLEESLLAAYEKATKKERGAEQVVVDAALSLDDVVRETYTDIERIGPFGMGNPKPLFLFERALVDSVALFGKEKNHLKVVFCSPRGRSVEAIAFFSTPESFSAVPVAGQLVSLIAHIEKSVFMSQERIRLRIVDIC